MTDVDIAVAISLGAGWLELEDEENGYEVGANSFAERTLTAKQRKVGEEAVWLKGSPTLASAPGNVTENLEVYVTAPDPFTFDTRVQVLVDAVGQLTFQIRRTIGNSRQTWDCYASPNVRIQTSQPFFVATTGLVAVEVNRYPDVTLESVP